MSSGDDEASFDRVSLSSAESWDVLDRAEISTSDREDGVSGTTSTCAICGVYFGNIHFVHPYCGSCRLCVHCVDIARQSLITTCHCYNRACDGHYPLTHDVFIFEPVNAPLPPSSSSSSSIESIPSATEDEDEIEKMGAVTEDPTMKTVAQSDVVDEPSQDVSDYPTDDISGKSELTPPPASRQSIVESVIEVLKFETIEFPKIDRMSPIPSLVPLDVPLVNLQTCNLNMAFKFWSPAVDQTTNGNGRRSRLDSTGSNCSVSSLSASRKASFQPAWTPSLPINVSNKKSSTFEFRTSNTSSPGTSPSFSCSPPRNWPLLNCPNIFDTAMTKTVDLSPPSFSQLSIQSKHTDSPVITAAPFEEDEKPPRIRSHAWDADRFRDLIRPKPIPNSILEAINYPIR